MTLKNPDALWAQLRTPGFESGAAIVTRSAPAGITGITHLGTSRYAAFRVDSPERSWLVRVGATSPTDSGAPDNTGPLGTALAAPTGQKRGYDLARSLGPTGAGICVPVRYVRFDGTADEHSGFDALWLPFIDGRPGPVTADQWAQALQPLHAHRPGSGLPVFTDRARTMERLAAAGDSAGTRELAAEYDRRLEELFAAATQWGTVHGDARPGTVLVAGGRAVLFDLDTACWAPSVWDLTHLLSRAEDGSGYTTSGLLDAFGFSAAEVRAAVRLRRTSLAAERLYQDSLSRTGRALLPTG